MARRRQGQPESQRADRRRSTARVRRIACPSRGKEFEDCGEHAQAERKQVGLRFAGAHRRPLVEAGPTGEGLLEQQAVIEDRVSDKGSRDGFRTPQDRKDEQADEIAAAGRTLGKAREHQQRRRDAP